MNELVSCIDIVVQMMGKCCEAEYDPRGFHRQVTARLTRWFEEGLDIKTVIDLLNQRKHEKEDARAKGESNHDHLGIDDFNVIEQRTGLNEVTSENQKRWEAKFKSGRARYWCPKCGYAGNGEFVVMPSSTFGADFLMCGRPGCNHFAYSKYFTRDWTPEAQATFERECEAKRQAVEAKQIKKTADLERQKKLRDEVRTQAIIAVKEIDQFQWTLNGDDAEQWSWDEQTMEPEIKRVMQLMLLPLTERWGPLVPQDEIVAFFKTNLRPCEEKAAEEFKRCAQAFLTEMVTVMEEGL